MALTADRGCSPGWSAGTGRARAPRRRVEPLGWVGPDALETAKELYRTHFHGVEDPADDGRESA